MQYVWEKILETIYSTFLPWCCLPFVHVVFYMSCVYCCQLCVLLQLSCVYCCHLMCICCTMCVLLFLLQMPDCRLEVSIWKVLRPSTLTGFSWFPCVYKQMLRWFARFQVATTCFLCSPPNLNLLVTNFVFCIHLK